MNDIHGSSFMIHRREILRDSLRWGALLTLGGVASALGWRSLHGSCRRANPCGACPMLSGCDLPPAINAKNHGGQASNRRAANPDAKHV